MSNKKIIVCTTMRDFNGSDNDLIQIKFLESIKAQSYKNIEVVITLFGEKRVEEMVGGFLPQAVFFEGSLEDYRYSLTQVLHNAILYAENKKYVDYAVLWTTCDVLYKNNFIEICEKYLENKTILTSHPHQISTLEGANTHSSWYVSSLVSGFDMMFFTSKVLKDLKINKACQDYIFKDWGVYEHFLISLAALANNVEMINVYEESSIIKIENNRLLTNEPNKFLIDSHKRNSIVFKKFLDSNSLSFDYFNLTFCHLRFRVTKHSLKHYIPFVNDLFYYIGYLVRRQMSRLTPNPIKKLFGRG